MIILDFISKLLVFVMMIVLSMVGIYYMYLIYADWDEYEDSTLLMYIKIIGVFLIVVAIQIILGRYLIS